MSEEIRVSSPAQGEIPEQIVHSASSATDLESEGAMLLNVGQQLRAAREAKGMSVADVAKVLKLSVNQVVALEEEDWARLHGNTIIRGFVRNYARLFKLDTEPLMGALCALQLPQTPKLDLPAGTNTALPSTGKPERRDVATVFSGLVLVVVAALVYFFMPQNFWQGKLMEYLPRFNSPEPGVEKNEKPLDSAAAVQLAPATVPVAVDPVPAVLPTPSQTAGVAASSELQKDSVVTSSSGLKLSFSQPSWVEIRDRSGEVIFSQLSPAGSQRDIEGQPPFALVIGNATNVTVQYKGKVIELLQRSKDDVARLTLD